MALAVRFDGLVFSVAQRSLVRDGRPVFVGSRGLDLLARLLEQPGEVIPSDELMRAGWGKVRVQPNNLSVQISALRKALGTRADGDPFIRTVSGRGYVLHADRVDRVDETASRFRRRWPPAYATGFVGRAAELRDLRATLDGARLLTLVGPGGVGKTRLLQQALSGTTRPWAGVDLAPVGTGKEALSAIAAALGDVGDTLQSVIARLQYAPLLLVLDNAEHLVAELSGLLRTVLEECPDSAVAVTSRIVLHVPGETVVRLAPLALPSESARTVAEIGAADSVRLFVERAAAAMPGFALTADNCDAVAALCRRLDGLALAIEMLVPRLRSMSPAEILLHLHERFRLFSGAGPEVLPRQRTLATMLDWSWELLDPLERTVLGRVAMFRGPPTAAAVAAMEPPAGRADFLSGPDVLDGLAGLADKSLVTPEPSPAGTRFRLLQTTRDYVTTVTPEPALQIGRAHHAALMVERFAAALADWPSAPTGAWLDENAPLLDDLRAALSWCSRDGANGEGAIRLAAWSLPLWLELPGTPLGEMHGWFDRVAPLLGPHTPAADLAMFRIGQTWRATQFGDVQHRPWAEEAVAAAARSNSRTVLGVALMRFGHTLMRSDTMAEAASAFDDAERALRADPPGKWLSLVLARRADALVRLGQLDLGLRVYEEAIDLAEALEFRLGRVVGVSNMTEVLFTLGERERAIERLRALVTDVPVGARNPAVATLAAHLALAGLAAAAAAAVVDVATWAPVTGMEGPLAWAAEAAALLLARVGRFGAAATLAGYARRILPALEIRFGSRRAVFEELATRLEVGLPAGERAQLEAAGAAMGLHEAARSIMVTCKTAPAN